MITAFFLADSLLFWGFLSIAALFLIYYTFNEKGSGATLTVFITIGVLIAFSNLPVVATIRSLHAWQIIEYVGGYIGVGLVYLVLKWTYNTFEIKKKYSDFREKWLVSYNMVHPPTPITAKITEIPLNSQKAFIIDACNNIGFAFGDLPPKIRNHKADLIFWGTYWPLSATFTILDNPLQWLIDAFIRMMTNPLNKISHMMFQKFDELQ